MTRRQILGVLAAACSAVTHGCAARKDVLCLGDSITKGTGLKRPELESYPAELQRLLRRTATVQNLGVPGTTVSPAGDRPFRLSGQREQVERLKPAFSVVLLGTNDSKAHNWRGAPTFEAHFHELAAELVGMIGARRIVLTSPPPAWENDYGVAPAIVADEIAPTIARSAAALGTLHLDLWALFRDRRDRFPDGVHPDALAAAQIAAAVAPLLVESLARN